MKKHFAFICLILLAARAVSASAQAAEDPVAAKYARGLAAIFERQAKFEPINKVFAKVYPVAIVENKTFYIFEPAPGGKTYRLALTAPDTFNIPTGIRAAMPLSFWNNRMACVVTGEVFDQPDGYVFIFHEFVHCFQWECCEMALKEGLSIYREAMKSKNYMWELQYPFRYDSPDFVRLYPQVIAACDADDAPKVESLRAELKKSLSAGEWEYLGWEEWKEGLARYLENRMRSVIGLPENKGGETAPFSRVTFYRGGDAFIRFLERRRPGVTGDIMELFRVMVAFPAKAF